MNDEKIPASSTLTLEMLQKTIRDLANREPTQCHHPVVKKFGDITLCAICGHVLQK